MMMIYVEVCLCVRTLQKSYFASELSAEVMKRGVRSFKLQVYPKELYLPGDLRPSAGARSLPCVDNGSDDSDADDGDNDDAGVSFIK